jgi:diketogulonate reductase-like aldo/keto reductase
MAAQSQVQSHSLFGAGTYRLKTATVVDDRITIDQAYASVMQSLMSFHWDIEGAVLNIDTAPSYGTEESVGRAIADFISKFKIKRSRIKITTKVSRPSLVSGEYPDIKASVEQSLENLGIEYIDEVLIHQPVSAELSLVNWGHLVRFLEEHPSKIRVIGVSNYNVKHLQQIQESDIMMPVINQIEFTPFLKRDMLYGYCSENSIAIVAHSPLAKGERFTRTITKKKKERKIDANPILKEIAISHDISEAQVLIYWALSKGVRIIPRSSDDMHISENFKTFRSVIEGKNPLTADDLDMLDSIEETDHHSTHPQYLRH